MVIMVKLVQFFRQKNPHTSVRTRTLNVTGLIFYVSFETRKMLLYKRERGGGRRRRFETVSFKSSYPTGSLDNVQYSKSYFFLEPTVYYARTPILHKK